MFSIKETSNTSNTLDFIEIQNSEKTCYAKIYMNAGGSLQELKLDSKAIIEDLSPLTYKDTYASAILFPFANRIKDGSYVFDDKKFTFEINEKANNNALHGLVYNKTFRVIDDIENSNFASITLEYIEEKESLGFPYTYGMQLKYLLKNDSLEIYVTITNTSANPFPFTLGWHPYFSSADLYGSTLHFKSDKQLVLDERGITSDIKTIDMEPIFQIKDKQLDDCFILASNQIQFNTPNYNLEISTSSEENFLQIYTPPLKNKIAIEPTTGVSNSFNNKIGLQILEPHKTYQINWNVVIK